jgi:hypothetical protein
MTVFSAKDGKQQLIQSFQQIIAERNRTYASSRKSWRSWLLGG